jgi:hypothetical protein
MKYLKNNLSAVHLALFAILLIAFTILTYCITDAGVDDGFDHDARVWQSTLGTVAGPFTGALSRGLQACCLQFSLTLTIVCGPALLVGILMQFVNFSAQNDYRPLRLVFWVAGWLIWFAGGIVSFAHALS